MLTYFFRFAESKAQAGLALGERGRTSSALRKAKPWTDSRSGLYELLDFWTRPGRARANFFRFAESKALGSRSGHLNFKG